MISIDEVLSQDIGARSDSQYYADGPFVLEHNNDITFGKNLEQAGEILLVASETIVYPIDDSYMVEVSDNGSNILLLSEKYTSLFTIRPITLDDASWAYPGYSFKSLERFKNFISEQMLLLNSYRGEEMSKMFGVTLDETGVILDLIMSDETGIFIRDDSQWIAIDTDSEEESDAIDGLEWVDVDPSIIDFYDENLASDTIVKADIAPFIVN